MEHLPYIDEHRIHLDATRDQAWDALVVVLSRQLGGARAAPVARVLGVRPPVLCGDWSQGPRAGDALPGFEVAQSQPATRLALRGEHRFARYALVFDLDGNGAAGCTLGARTWAAFPGARGRGYRALVIASGAHRRVVRRLLRDVDRLSVSHEL